MKTKSSLCEKCPFIKRLFCLSACPPVNDILNRIDEYLIFEDRATQLYNEMRQRRKDWLGER